MIDNLPNIEKNCISLNGEVFSVIPEGDVEFQLNLIGTQEALDRIKAELEMEPG